VSYNQDDEDIRPEKTKGNTEGQRRPVHPSDSTPEFPIHKTRRMPALKKQNTKRRAKGALCAQASTWKLRFANNPGVVSQVGVFPLGHHQR